MSKTIEFEWLQDPSHPSHPRYPLADSTASLVAVHQPLIKAARVWKRNGVWVNNMCFPDGFEAKPKPSFATDAEARQHAESALGVVTVPEATAIPLRWDRDQYGITLSLGGFPIVLVAQETHTERWGVLTGPPLVKHRVNALRCQTGEQAMRAVEAAFGITSPLPVETAVAP